jgi:hypothetical protein
LYCDIVNIACACTILLSSVHLSDPAASPDINCSGCVAYVAVSVSSGSFSPSARADIYADPQLPNIPAVGIAYSTSRTSLMRLYLYAAAGSPNFNKMLSQLSNVPE